MSNKIGELIRRRESDYISGTTTKSKHVSFSMIDDLDKIDAYANSKHTTGETDSLGREKPFFNIVTSAINIWYRATDLDRKDIKLRANKEKDYITAFVGRIMLQTWMRKTKFGQFLNEWGRTLAKYGSAVVKFVEKDGELKPRVIPWNTLIVDAVDFDANPVIEVLELTPAQLRQRKGYDQDVVEKLIETKTTRETIDGQNKDNISDYIKIYEIHGELPLSLLTEDEDDEDTYVQQMHVVSFVGGANGDYDDFCLAKGKESKDPYMITHLIPEDGQTLATGAVKNLFEAQWMINHSMKQIKDQLDLASKLIFQTSDANFVGMNALESIETGDILVHSPNQPLTQMANNSHDITSLQNYAQQWKVLGNEINGISEAMQGATPKSGTAWRQTEAILQESHSLFELMTENKGLFLEDMFRTYVLPYIKKQLKNKDELVATLDDYGIRKIEAKYIKNEAVKRVKEDIKQALLRGELPTDIDPANAEKQITTELADLGSTRFLVPSEIESKTWADMFKDFEWDIEVDVTGEEKDTQAHLATMVTLFQTLIAQGQVEAAKKVMNKILEITGAFSPVEIEEIPVAQPQQTEAPEMSPEAMV